VLIQLLGLYWLAMGLVQFAGLFVDSNMWGWKLVLGTLGVVAGLVTIQHPLWATILIPTTLGFLVGLLGLILGVTGIVSAFAGSGWGSGIIGALSAIFGLALMLNPVGAGYWFIIALAIAAIIGGTAGAIVAFRERNVEKGGQAPGSSGELRSRAA
jgi:uncharacterized membrane protein HdeD (DUF308 family)